MPEQAMSVRTAILAGSQHQLVGQVSAPTHGPISGQELHKNTPQSPKKAAVTTSDEVWQQLLHSKLETISLKLEIAERNQQQGIIRMESKFEKYHADMMTTLAEMQEDMRCLKRRQDLVFRKQDIIHSTLAGEFPKFSPDIPTGYPAHRGGISFRSPSNAPSVVAWSPPFPPLQHHLPISGDPQQSAEKPHEIDISEIEATYTTHHDESVDLETFSNDDIQSFRSLDLEGAHRKKKRTAEPPSFSTISGIPHAASQFTTELPAFPVSASSRGNSPFGISHFTSYTQHMMTADDISKMHPQGNVPANTVINYFLSKNESLDLSNVGRLAVLLARYSFFGDEVLRESTLKGKGSRPGLNQARVESLVSMVNNQYPFSMMSVNEFRQKVRPKIERALTDFLKPSQKKLGYPKN